MTTAAILRGICVVLAITTAAHANDAPADHPLTAGSDFCFARTYDRKHLAAHPAQTVTSMQVMGRNAWRAPPSPGSVYATMIVTFRTGKPLLMNGRCFAGEGTSDKQLRCKFLLDTMQDMLIQSAALTWPSVQSMQVDVTADWGQLRRREEPTDDQRPVAKQDARFLLTRGGITSCAFPKRFWNKDGPSGQLLGQLP